MKFNKDRIKMKVAISKFKEEYIVMENKTRNIFKAIVITITSLLLGTGVVYAGTIVYEKIWKTPEKINFSLEITEEVKQENITEEKAKEIAIKKFNDIGFNSNIVNAKNFKNTLTDAIIYQFQNEDNYQIDIDGKTGEFKSFCNRNRDIQDRSIYITKEQAVEVANKYYKLFGYYEGEYELAEVTTPVGKYGGHEDDEGVRFQITYNKKYGDVFNPYETIGMAIESKNLGLESLYVTNIPFDNNDVALKKDEAINIALNEDSKIDTNKVEHTQANLMIVKMNGDAYHRINNKEQYYKEMQTTNYPNEEREYYIVDDKVRRAWVVTIFYEDNYGGDIVKRLNEGRYSYFVDATTGEIIGGSSYIYNEYARLIVEEVTE